MNQRDIAVTTAQQVISELSMFANERWIHDAFLASSLVERTSSGQYVVNREFLVDVLEDMNRLDLVEILESRVP